MTRAEFESKIPYELRPYYGNYGPSFLETKVTSSGVTASYRSEKGACSYGVIAPNWGKLYESMLATLFEMGHYNEKWQLIKCPKIPER